MRLARQRRSYANLVEYKRREYGEKFDDKDLSKKFIPHYESGDRIEVKFSYGETLRGRVGSTMGWKPVFILLRTTRSQGSHLLLTDKDEIVKVF